MAKGLCKNCRFFEPITATTDELFEDAEDFLGPGDAGECHRFPPVLMPDEGGDKLIRYPWSPCDWSWPRTSKDSWCGEFRVCIPADG
jgi:hypothetical protein